ncbi:MAG TPA: class I SAM-dependent rRNA methyltransferase [Gemmataceae bacterium]|jgi:23S rRNA (cytosine1962-C5)-methyltransferase|nr:class I SAM-dependent rRNA methyltransferase [Gemmataceae bacterium]
MSVPKAILKPKRAQPFLARHPWVFSGLIDRVEGEPADGAEIDLHSSAGVFIARGLFNSKSKIRIRLYSWQPGQALEREFFHERITRAVRLRDDLGLRGPGRGCRLVFSEADGLSGCTIDEYAGWMTIQMTALGIAGRREIIADVLNEVVQPRGIYLRTEKGVGALEGLELHDGLLAGEPPPSDLMIEEDGVSFLVNIAEGQKTGFYHDQRDNRRAAARLAAGRRVLDCFGYTGGFGLHAARAGATSVECVDVSEPALALGRRNAEHNGLTQVAFTRSDAFRLLDGRVRDKQQYDLIVLDPPKFARSRSSIPEALNGYGHLLKQAIKLTEPGGYIVFCCCSGLITAEMLAELIGQIAGEERRDVQIVERRGAAPDHPVAASCPETAYLKCFILRIS